MRRPKNGLPVNGIRALPLGQFFAKHRQVPDALLAMRSSPRQTEPPST
jgi:hypothetical protein